MFYRPSASNLERAINCRASCIIPFQTRTTNEAAERGSQIHKYVELIISGLSSDAALLRIPDEYKENCRHTDTSFLVGLTDIKSEVSYAVDFETGKSRVLGQGLDRDYPEVGESEFVGTLDIVAMRGEVPVIIDMKSGLTTTPAKLNYQIKFAVCAVTGLEDFSLCPEEIETRLLYLREDNDNFSDVYIYKKQDVSQSFYELKRFYRKLIYEAKQFEEHGHIQMHEGFHCAYCPCQLFCPAKTAAIRALGEKAEDSIDEEGNFEINYKINKKNAAKAWENYQKIKTYYEAAEKSVKSYAQTHGIKGDTFKVTPTECKRTKLDATKLVHLSRKLGASDSDLTSCRTMTKFVRLQTKKLDVSTENEQLTDNLDTEEE